MMPVYSFVIPVLDERDTLPELYERLVGVMGALDGECEVVLVDDGSTDGSYEIMVELHAATPASAPCACRATSGTSIAITAGLEHTQGRAVIIMDADLQDPPEVAVELARRWREGYDVVYAVRDDRDGESRFKLANRASGSTASWAASVRSRSRPTPVTSGWSTGARSTTCSR